MKFNINHFLFVMTLGLALFNCEAKAPEGQKVEATEAEEVAKLKSETVVETFAVNIENSTIEWEGTEPGDEGHRGTISIMNGQIQVQDGTIAGGTFIIDMNSINVTDMTGGRKAKLESHLKDGDFFEVERFPQAGFTFTHVTPLTDNQDANFLLSGNLIMRDSTKNIQIPAMVNIADGKLTAKTPKFTIDRTKWGVKYRSGLIGTVKNKLIHDEIGLAISLEAGL